MKVCPDCERQYGEDVAYCAHDGAKLRIVENESGDPLLGRVLDDRWRIEEKIGEGGMGAIYLASQSSVEREVVVKTLRAALSDNEEFSERFMQEARVTSTINHPHCVTIFDFGRAENNTLYLAMELLDGEPLDEPLERGPIEVQTTLEVGSQVASALSAAHDYEIVHRDLKPENIFLLDIPDGSTFVKVLDFGISKDLGADDDMTKTGQLFGTPRYMSPEQSRGDDLDGRSDLYSLGCILYEMLSGQTPFDGEKSMEILVAHVQEEVPPISEVADRELPAGAVDLVMQLLEKEPEDRPGDAGDVRHALDEILSDWDGAGSEAAGTDEAEQTDQAQQTDGADELDAMDQEEAADSDEWIDGGTQPGLGPERERDEDLRADAEPAGPIEQEAEDDSTEDIVGEPPPGDRRAPRRAEVTERETLEEPRDWVGDHRGLVLGLVGLAVVAGLLVCGGGVFFYGQAQNEGEGPLANLFGAGAPDDAAGGDATQGTDAAETDASGGSQEEERAVAARKQARKREANQEAKQGTKQPGGSTGRAGSADEETDREGGATGGTADAEPNSGASGESGEAGSEERGEADGSGDEGATTGTSGGPAPAEESGGAGGEAEREPAEDRPADDEGSETTPGGAEPPERMRDPAEFVRRTELSTTGEACDDSDVERRLGRAEAALGRCYRQSFDPPPGPSGTMMLEWNISTDGSAMDLSVLKSDFSDSGLAACVVRRIEALDFSPSSGGRCYTRVTFAFEAR